MNLLPILTDSGKYPQMEIGLFQTESSYNYAVEWDICEIPTLKPISVPENCISKSNCKIIFGWFGEW